MEYNGYRFRDGEVRENTKYIVITDGDLDLNGAYGVNSKPELKSLIKECRGDGSTHRIQAIFRIKRDVTKDFL